MKAQFNGRECNYMEGKRSSAIKSVQKTGKCVIVKYNQYTYIHKGKRIPLELLRPTNSLKTYSFRPLLPSMVDEPLDLQIKDAPLKNENAYPIQLVNGIVYATYIKTEELSPDSEIDKIQDDKPYVIRNRAYEIIELDSTNTNNDPNMRSFIARHIVPSSIPNTGGKRTRRNRRKQRNKKTRRQ